ncbi:MAG: tRNA (adenosine(37)-N6)-threonylcarbamoyltransferase complex dimerization subunit type 1 TsaB [Chloracidobacterium sp. CP2_5A]|nr:MAG: tRNA (adenosine(37)-N6)-threonylcarbamoyltransferase complex dimerization subunit type 1 TsaB [Chloracidobacterium sp. CP2_5A]
MASFPRGQGGRQVARVEPADPTAAPADWWLVADTASPRLSLALARGRELHAQWGVKSQRPSVHRVVGDIAYLLERTGVQPKDLSAVGALVGPGSFTGIRVGLAAVKGLAQPRNLPIVTATTLEVAAGAIAAREPTAALVVNVSHRREVHGQGFLVEPGAFPEAFTEALAGDVAQVVDRLAAQSPSDRPRVITGDALTLLDDARLAVPIGDWARQPPPPWLAPAALPRLAARLAEGATISATRVAAFYARAALAT